MFIVHVYTASELLRKTSTECPKQVSSFDNSSGTSEIKSIDLVSNFKQL